MDAEPLIVIAGPTGSGKSSLSLAVCEAAGGEAVNCDSLQVYRYFDIGTAKLPLEERRGIPHHLVDILNPDELCSAGEYARMARETMVAIRRRGRVPVVVGGTGFYLKALLDGLFPGPQRDAELRTRLAAREQRRPGGLHRLLRRWDPAAASRIHPNDTPKVIRALEVYLLTRRPVTEMFAAGRDALEGYQVLLLGLTPPREALYRQIDNRCQQMFDDGLLDEVRSIEARGYSLDLKPFEAHGYRQAVQVIRGELRLKDAVFYAQRNTRHYAKRQVTWFRADPRIEWLPGFGAEPDVQASALRRVSEFLSDFF